MSKTSSQRSRIMAAVKSRDTRPERTVARQLRAAGIRYRRQGEHLPGRPDFVLIGVRIVLFVHGCWWHGHSCPRAQRVPKTNRDYWLKKIARNRQRDRQVARQLRALDYSVWTLWECRLKQGLPGRLASKVWSRLDS